MAQSLGLHRIAASGDVLAREVRLSRPREGDALAILEAGAYGSSMALTYLDTSRPLELLWMGEGWEVLRWREPLERLFEGES